MPSLSASSEYHRAATRVAVAQICQSLGWQSASATALDVLVDVMQNQLTAMAKLTGRYANQFDRTLANLDDLGLALRDFGVPISELEEYVSAVEPPAFPHPVPPLPVARPTNLSFLKPGSQEIVTRPIHVYEHLPPMYPDTVEEDAPDGQALEPAGGRGPTGPTSSPGLKRPGDPLGGDPKRGRFLPEEEGRPMREILSVMMTTSGFISPAREGKLPEARLPDPLDDFGDDYRHVKTRKQRADTYRRLSERENERRNRDRWLREDDLFDIIDVKVEEEEPGAAASPEKLPTATQAAKLKPFKKHVKPEPAPARPAPAAAPAAIEPPPPPPRAAASPKVKPEPDKAKAKKAKPKPVDVKSSKLSIFKKKIAKKKQQGTSEKPSTGKTSPPPAEAPPEAKAAAPAAAPPPKKKPKKKPPPMLPDEPQLFSSPAKPVEVPAKPPAKAKAADKAAAKGSSEKTPAKAADKPASKAAVKSERPAAAAARPRSPSPPVVSTSSLTPPGTPGTPRAPEPRRKPSAASPGELSPRSDGSGTPDRPRTPELPGRREASPPPPPPNPAALLNNPLIPRFPFPFGGGAGAEGVPPPPFPGMPGLRPPPSLFLGTSAATSGPSNSSKSRAKSPEERKERTRSAATRSLDPRRSPSETSEPSRSPTPDISAMTPLKRLELELADRAEKKKEKEHKKNKKEKKEKKKKDKKDKEKKEVKSEKKDKKKKEEKEKAPGKVHEGRDEAGPKLSKLTLRINSPEPAASRTPTPEPPPPKLTIKPVKEQPEPSTSTPTRSKKKPEKKKAEEPPPPPPPPPKSAKKEKEKKKSPVSKPKKTVSPPKAQPAAVIAETVGSFLDSEGNRIWICPECGRQDDGSPMIGCDSCDDWYHWVCVGIQVPPGDEDWYCPRCIAKMQGSVKQKGKGRGKKK